MTMTSLNRAHALAPEYYIGEAQLAREQRQVFARSWQLIAHQEQLAGHGDHVVDRIAGTPLLVVRGEDGRLRAFANVCRHRAGPLALCNGRGAKKLHCKYHGWTYDLAGQLRIAPEMQGAEGFDPGAIHLHEFRVAEWQGQVFVAMDPAVPDIAEVYGGITARIAPVDLAAMKFHRQDSYDIACNWKVYIDNYLEGYHLPYVHPGLSKVLDYRAYDTEVFDWYSLQHSPMRNNSGIYGDGDAWYFFIYPNVMLNIMPGRLQTNRILPLAPDRCRVVFDYFYRDDEDTRARIAADAEFSEEIQQEDIAICEAVQLGLASRHYEPGRLCPKREAGVFHFQNLLRAAYGEDTGRTA